MPRVLRFKRQLHWTRANVSLRGPARGRNTQPLQVGANWVRERMTRRTCSASCDRVAYRVGGIRSSAGCVSTSGLRISSSCCPIRPPNIPPLRSLYMSRQSAKLTGSACRPGNRPLRCRGRQGNALPCKNIGRIDKTDACACPSHETTLRQ